MLVHACTEELAQCAGSTISQSTRIHTEYHSVCPLVGIRTPPTPLPQTIMPPPLNQRVGGTLACGRGVGGVPILTTGEKAWHSVYPVIYIVGERRWY